VNFFHKLVEKPQKKLLSLDGGGIRGIITIEILAKIEYELKTALRADDTFRLCEYFDYIGGTSTGAIIATALSLGMSVDEIRRFYIESGELMFDKANLLKRYRFKYNDESLSNQLKNTFGEKTLLGSEKFKTLLLLILRNATTDSPWPLSNNPKAKFNNIEQGDNLKFPVWQLVRASTAAPTYFPPEPIFIKNEPQAHLFVDGGVTMYNNPAFKLFLMATAEPYQLKWQTGADKILLVSIGTGYAADANRDLQEGDMNILYNASKIPSALMYAAMNEQDSLCRMFGDCRFGHHLDAEIGDMIGQKGPDSQKLFTYLRYNVDLSQDGLNNLGLNHIKSENVQEMDKVAFIKDMQEISIAVANDISINHFNGFIE